MDRVGQPSESIELEFRRPTRFRDGVSTALGEDGGEVHGWGIDSEPTTQGQGRGDALSSGWLELRRVAWISALLAVGLLGSCPQSSEPDLCSVATKLGLLPSP